jgi:hypothetical protein
VSTLRASRSVGHAKSHENGGTQALRPFFNFVASDEGAR